MGQKIIQVDSFTDERFSGNPAGVCVLDGPADEKWMQNIASELNLSETAFLFSEGDAFNLRWFTPIIEVDLCGHATLAAAHVLWESDLISRDEKIDFNTKSGGLSATFENDWIKLDFPAIKSNPCPAQEKLMDVLGVKPVNVMKADWVYIVELDSGETVKNLKPNFGELSLLEEPDIIVTAPDRSGEYDFVSRFFAPSVGINEDPVTGFAHCVLTPYWMSRLGKNELIAYQASKRGGTLKLSLAGNRVFISGQAVTVIKGELV